MHTYIGAAALFLATPSFADYGCGSIAWGWRQGRLGIVDGAPVVADIAGKGHRYDSASDSWSAISSTVIPHPDPAMVAVDYEADQWGYPREVSLTTAPSIVSIQQTAQDISGDGYTDRWLPQENFHLKVAGQVSTVTLKGVWGLRAAVRHPRESHLLYVLTQAPSGEDSPCGNNDGPGLILIDTKARTANLIFPKDSHGGVWALQFHKGKLWMLTSSGVCVGPERGGSRTCWSYHSARVTRPDGARTIRQISIGTESAVSFPATKGPIVKIVGGKQNRETGGLQYQIEHASTTPHIGVYVEAADVSPFLEKDG